MAVCTNATCGCHAWDEAMDVTDLFHEKCPCKNLPTPHVCTSDLLKHYHFHPAPPDDTPAPAFVPGRVNALELE